MPVCNFIWKKRCFMRIIAPSLVIVLVVLTFATLCQATPFTITNGQTVGQQTLDAGEVGTIDAGGTVTSSTLSAITLSGSAPTLTNNGTISVTGGSSAVTLGGNNSTFTNSGIISATGGSTIAIQGNSGIQTVNLETGSIITGAIDLGTGAGTINVNGSAIFNGDAILTAGIINVNGTLTSDGALSLNSTGSLVVDSGSLNVGASSITTSGSITLTADSTVSFDVGGFIGSLNTNTPTIINGSLTATGGVFFDPDTILEIDVTGLITSEAPIVIATSNATPTIPTIPERSGRISFSLTTNGNDLELTPTILTSVEIGLSGTNAEVNDVIDTAFANDDALMDVMNNMSTAELKTALDNLTPDVGGQGIVGAVSAGSGSSNTVSNRVASRRTGISAGQGLASGDGLNQERQFWLQGFGTYADQDVRQGVNGFTATTAGVALGGDKQINDSLLLGLAGSYAYTDADSSLSRNRTTVSSYQATLYGTYEVGKYFLDGQLGAAYNDYHGDRFINVGAIDRHANADYSGYLFLSQLELGRDMNLSSDFKFTSSLGLSWTHIGIEEYTETDAGASNLKVNKQDYDTLNLTARVKLRRTWDISNGSLTPEVHLGYNYDAIGDNIQTTTSFTGGGNTFQTTGFDPANHSVLGGMGFSFENDRNFDFIMSYDIEAKDNFVSHSALLKGSWKF